MKSRAIIHKTRYLWASSVSHTILSMRFLDGINRERQAEQIIGRYLEERKEQRLIAAYLDVVLVTALLGVEIK